MFPSILAFLSVLRVFFRSRSEVALEVLALRQQVGVLKRKRPRVSLNRLDKLFWTRLRRSWPRWAEVLLIVKPETVIGWHRAVSDSTGVGAPGRVADDHRSLRRFAS